MSHHEGLLKYYDFVVVPKVQMPVMTAETTLIKKCYPNKDSKRLESKSNLSKLVFREKRREY